MLEQVREAGAPGASSFEPTWYQTSTATWGMRWSSCRITSRPFGSVYFSKGSWGRSLAAPAGAGAGWAGAEARRAGRESEREQGGEHGG